MSREEYFKSKLHETGYELVEILLEDEDMYHCKLRQGDEIDKYFVYFSGSYSNQGTPTYSKAPTTNGSIVYEEITPVTQIITMHIFRWEKSIEYERCATAFHRYVSLIEKGKHNYST